MNTTKKIYATLAVSAASLALAAGAVAQDRGPGPQGPGGPGRPQGGPPGAGRMMERMHERQAERAKALHDVLGIKADQEGAFQAFQASMTPQRTERKGPGAERGQGPGAKAEAPRTTPERLDRQLARMDEMQKRMVTRVTAIKTFYAALTPEQRRTFDALPMLGGGGMMGHRGMRGGPQGPGPRA